DGGEGEELLLLGAQEWLCLEEGDDPSHQVLPVPDDVHQRGVRRSAVVLTYPSAAKPLPNQVEDLSALGRLTDMELGDQLITKPGARVPLDSDVERPVSVDIAADVGVQPFLLIARTGRIVTAHVITLRRGCDMN